MYVYTYICNKNCQLLYTCMLLMSIVSCMLLMSMLLMSLYVYVVDVYCFVLILMSRICLHICIYIYIGRAAGNLCVYQKMHTYLQVPNQCFLILVPSFRVQYICIYVCK